MQVEDVSERIGNLPALRQSRLDVEMVVARQQRVEEKFVNALGLPVDATRGSRFVGLLSIIMTSVLVSGGCEQERSGRSKAQRPGKQLSSKKDCHPERSEGLVLSCFFRLHLPIRDLPQNCRRFAPVAEGTLLGAGATFHAPARQTLPLPSLPPERRIHRRSATRLHGASSFATWHQRRIPVPPRRRSFRIALLSTCAESRQHKALNSARNRTRRQRRCRRHHVCFAGAMAELKKSADVFPTKFLAARRPRGFCRKNFAPATA